MALAGAGAGINELTALAVTSELAPTRKRGKYVAVLIFTILPFTPAVLWAQLIAQHSSWRFVGLFCGLWAFAGLVMTAIFYFPPPRDNSKGMTNRQIIAQIDFVGGFLSITGMILFIAGLVWGGYQVRILLYTIFFGSDEELVFLEISTCPGSPHPRRILSYRFCSLGNILCEIPYVPGTSKARSANPRLDACHHIHLRRQFLLRAFVLANAIIQCIWS